MRGKTEDGDWVIDKDLSAERVVLSLLQGKGAEARLTLEEAANLGQALVDVAASMRSRLCASPSPDEREIRRVRD